MPKAKSAPREFLPLAPLDNPEQWVVQAIRLYNITYDMMGAFTPTEYKNLAKRYDELYALTPEQYKTGFHVLAPGAAYLGEDIMMVDGCLTHPVHLHCPSCRRARLVSRSKVLFSSLSHRLWCLSCDKMVKYKDCYL